MCAIISKCAPRNRHKRLRMPALHFLLWCILSCTESKRKSEVVADSALYFDMTFYSFAYSHWHSSQLIQRQSQIPAIQLPEWELNFMILSCFLLGMFVGLVSFPTSLAILLQHLTMPACLTEHECRAFCPEVLDLSGQTCLKVVVLREHRTVCFAAAVTVSVACWRATMLLHRYCTMSLHPSSQMIMGDHVSQHMKFCLGVLTFPPVFFWALTLKIPRVQYSFNGVHLNHCFLLYGKELNHKEKRARRLKWILLDYHLIEGAAAILRRHEGIFALHAGDINLPHSLPWSGNIDFQMTLGVVTGIGLRV